MYMLILFPKYLTWNKHLINWYFLYIWTLYTNKIKKGSSIFKKSNRKIIFLNSMRKARFCTRSNKKACPKLSFSHVVSKNSVRYTNEKVILSSCGLFTLASLGHKRPPRGWNHFFAFVSKITILSRSIIYVY